MVAQARKQDQTSAFTSQIGHRLREGTLVVLLFVATYFLLALLTYSPSDPGWSYTGPSEEVRNAAGPAGAWFADVLLDLFGLLAYLFPVVVAWSGWLVFRGRGPSEGVDVHLMALRWLGFALTVAAGSALASIYGSDLESSLPMGAGGVLGELLRGELVAAFDGKHGWFWRNRTRGPVTITLKVQGNYTKLEKVI